MNPIVFFAELKRRNVYKVAVAYAVVGWLGIQIAMEVFPFFEIPNWGVRLVVLLIIIGVLLLTGTWDHWMNHLRDWAGQDSGIGSGL